MLKNFMVWYHFIQGIYLLFYPLQLTPYIAKFTTLLIGYIKGK